MIRPFTCVCMLLAAGSGLYLYQTKHRSQMLDRDITDTVHQAQAARERSSLLRAEWTLLNDPQRLADLAARFLPLKSTLPPQFTSLAELDKRLPPVGAPDVPAGSTDEPTDEVGTPMASAAPTRAPDAAGAHVVSAVSGTGPTSGTSTAGASTAGASTAGASTAVASVQSLSPVTSGAAAAATPASAAPASATPAGTASASAPVATARAPAAKPVLTAAARAAAIARNAARLAERAERAEHAERHARETAAGYGRAAPVSAPVPVVSTIATPLRPVPAYRPAAYGQPAPYSGSALGMARTMPSQPGGYAPYGN